LVLNISVVKNGCHAYRNEKRHPEKAPFNLNKAGNSAEKILTRCFKSFAKTVGFRA
jgi:hypothetical protein